MPSSLSMLQIAVNPLRGRPVVTLNTLCASAASCVAVVARARPQPAWPRPALCSCRCRFSTPELFLWASGFFPRLFPPPTPHLAFFCPWAVCRGRPFCTFCQQQAARCQQQAARCQQQASEKNPKERCPTTGQGPRANIHECELPA